MIWYGNNDLVTDKPKDTPDSHDEKADDLKEWNFERIVDGCSQISFDGKHWTNKADWLSMVGGSDIDMDKWAKISIEWNRREREKEALEEK